MLWVIRLTDSNSHAGNLIRRNYLATTLLWFFMLLALLLRWVCFLPLWLPRGLYTFFLFLVPQYHLKCIEAELTRSLVSLRQFPSLSFIGLLMLGQTSQKLLKSRVNLHVETGGIIRHHRRADHHILGVLQLNEAEVTQLQGRRDTKNGKHLYNGRWIYIMCFCSSGAFESWTELLQNHFLVVPVKFAKLPLKNCPKRSRRSWMLAVAVLSCDVQRANKRKSQNLICWQMYVCRLLQRPLCPFRRHEHPGKGPDEKLKRVLFVVSSLLCASEVFLALHCILWVFSHRTRSSSGSRWSHDSRYSRSYSGSRSRSPSVRRRRGSPSHLDRRRITRLRMLRLCCHR